MKKEENKILCKVIEVTTTYIALLINNYDYIKIGINKYDNEISIKRKILDELDQFVDPAQINEPFESINEIPFKSNTIIDIEDLQNEMYKITSDYISEETYNCDEIRRDFYPSIQEFVDAIYQKEINNNSKKYDEILKKVSLSYELVPESLGENIDIKQFEDLLNGL